MKKKFYLYMNNSVLIFQILGFRNKGDYGEIYVSTPNDTKTTIFRGNGLNKVIKQIKNK